MQDAVSEWLAAARHRFLVGYARSVIDSVGPAGAEFARIADSERVQYWRARGAKTLRSSRSGALSPHVPAGYGAGRQLPRLFYAR
jgi:hypothetical protein